MSDDRLQNAHDASNSVAGTRFPTGLLWVARLLLFVALFGASYLAIVAFKGGAIAGCGPDSGCDRVLSSHWAYWLGLPVSLPAFAIYISLLWATVAVKCHQSPRTQQISLQIIFTFGLLILAAAVWFILIQKLLVHSWCKICLATHANAGLAAALLLGAAFRKGAASIAPRHAVKLSVFGAMIGFSLLLAGQVMMKKKLYAVSHLHSRTAGKSLQILLHDGQFRLDPNELPFVGSVGVTNFVVSLFDYTCNHCRALHPLLKAAEKKYRAQLGIVALPVPLDATCNPLVIFTAPANQGACEYAKIGLAVWRSKPESFSQFDDWVFSSAVPPPLDKVREFADALVGKESIDRALSSSWLARQLQTDIALYQANSRLVGDARLPQLVLGDAISHGAIDNLDELLNLIQVHLPVRLSVAGTGRDQVKVQEASDLITPSTPAL
jgi:uncharacterized membrane protein